MTAATTLRDFFEQYASTSFGGAPEALAAFYDTSFLAAGPKGGAAFPNDDAFKGWLREVRAFNLKTGMSSLAVDKVSESTIGGGYTLAAVTWVVTFVRTGDTPLRFDISYLVRHADDGWKIAAYISHDDQEEMMRANGLL